MNNHAEERNAEWRSCRHPSCTCEVEPEAVYCSVQCEAMEEIPDIDCRCGHAQCQGRAD